ncbi:lysophospholipid acyltransferase family protein [Parasulfitobacter algicola]|uniref:1-acyl-sn-glycerol-3-phosphate acyltransferase n=1 Tax=Parasulfitobacter algicola TaxID=2614809 RepID=A0ABX2IXS0_9RHOB|nr:1-acyl-sn-glycerol-3-phosphate acyltransferase [Sulfitobacter algicola]NSX55281.1 1-acyl-sn-glycerol-3-phosphate acyltransferase [Sulfitobacter algicola]
MSQAWDQGLQPQPVHMTLAGWLRAGLRAVPLALVTFGCLAVLLLIRLFERPLCGVHRPVTPFITQFVCWSAFRIMGIKHRVTGEVMKKHGAVVANHGSWLDIFALNVSKRIYFVSKSEVADWPGIGLLARATGTVFINRDRREAQAQKQMFQDRLKAGHKLLFFPEGTSTDGQRVLPFKSTLFAAFLTDELKDILWIQPVSVLYTAPNGEDVRFYGWWGDMGFGSHLKKILAARRQGRVDVVYHPPVRIADFSCRKSLAKHLERVIRDAVLPQLTAGS